MREESGSEARNPQGSELLLRTAHLDLMAIDEAAIPELHRIAMMPAVRRNWRTRGQYVSPSDWMNLLFGQSLFQSYARNSFTGSLVGYTELFDASMVDGYAHLSTFSHPSTWNTGLPLEHAIGTLTLAFDKFPLRKVVAHVPEENLTRLSNLHHISTRVGTLTDHLLIDGEYADVAIFEISRVQLNELVANMFSSVLERRSAVATSHRADTDRHRHTIEDGGLEDALAAFDEWADSLPGESWRIGDKSIDDLDSLHWVEILDIVESIIGRAVEPDALRAGGSVSDIRRFLESDLVASPP